jgi:hypothetical protein
MSTKKSSQKIIASNPSVKKSKIPPPKYSFSITDISVQEIINLHFGISEKSSKNTNVVYISETFSKKSDENSAKRKSEIHLPPLFINEQEKNNKKLTCFLDAKKNKVKLWPIMIDVNGTGVLPIITNKPCRNCHHTFDTKPLGCPIKYIPDIKDDKNPLKLQFLEFFKNCNYQFDSTYCFGTEKLFCSRSCIKSYILECLSVDPLSTKYNNALSYLTIMAGKLYNLPYQKIRCADSIDALEAYGGHLTISEFRNPDKEAIYELSINMKRPVMFSCVSYVEEHSTI